MAEPQRTASGTETVCGIVKSFDQAGGHGYILGDDGETLWVHRGSITAKEQELVPGQRVVFHRQEGGMGVQAVDVSPAEVGGDGRSRRAP